MRSPSLARGGGGERRRRVSNPRRHDSRGSIAPWRGAAAAGRGGRAVMTSGRRRAGPRRPGKPPPPSAGHGPAGRHRGALPQLPRRRLPLGHPQDRGGAHRRLLPVRRVPRPPPPRRAPRRPPLTAFSFLPQRRGVADLHQRARVPPHAALHHVLQVSAGAAGPLPAGNGGPAAGVGRAPRVSRRPRLGGGAG